MPKKLVVLKAFKLIFSSENGRTRHEKDFAPGEREFADEDLAHPYVKAGADGSIESRKATQAREAADAEVERLKQEARDKIRDEALETVARFQGKTVVQLKAEMKAAADKAAVEKEKADKAAAKAAADKAAADKKAADEAAKKAADEAKAKEAGEQK